MTSPPLTLEEAIKLHGQKGPWLILGYRAGLRACEVLNPKGYHSLHCVAYIPLKIPYTCSLDGIQASTGCTLGKLNIEIHRADVKDIRFIFINKENGKKLELRLNYDIVKEVIKGDMIKASKFVEERPLWKLFKERLYD